MIMGSWKPKVMQVTLASDACNPLSIVLALSSDTSLHLRVPVKAGQLVR